LSSLTIKAIEGLSTRGGEKKPEKKPAYPASPSSSEHKFTDRKKKREPGRRTRKTGGIGPKTRGKKEQNRGKNRRKKEEKLGTEKGRVHWTGGEKKKRGKLGGRRWRLGRKKKRKDP